MPMAHPFTKNVSLAQITVLGVIALALDTVIQNVATWVSALRQLGFALLARSIAEDVQSLVQRTAMPASVV